MALMRRASTTPELFEPFGRLFEWPDWFAERFTSEHEMIKVEEFQDGDDYVVRAEMPGIDPDKDVEVTMTEGVLRIRAEKRQESKTEDKGGYRSEFHYGTFTRALRMPAGAKPDDVKATYKDGVLEVRAHVDRTQASGTTIPVSHQ
jgi:HSP20 family protein